MDTIKKVYNDHPKTFLYSTAAAIRLLLATVFPGLPDLLTGRVEISTPVNSFKRLQEGLFLYERGLDPYDGGIFHQAPLLLPLFSFLPSPSTWIGCLISVLLYTCLDLLSADLLYQIAESGAATVSRYYTSPRKEQAWRPISVAAVYLLNPYTLLTCLARPTTVFTTFFIFLSINHACSAKMITSAFALAIATYLSLHPLFLLPPIGLLCYDRLCLEQTASHTNGSSTAPISASSKSRTDTQPTPPKAAKIATDQRAFPSALTFSLQVLSIYTLILVSLLLLSRTFLPSWSFLSSVYLTPLTLPDLTPNSGLWWYFFTEMFDAFRNFFLGVFWLHMGSCSIPFCLRMRKQAGGGLAAVVAMLGIIAVFQPYANIGDTGAWLSASCLLSHVFELSTTHRYPLPALTALLYCTFLGPAFHHLWIYAGSGNANFFYAITLVWNLGLLVLETDLVYCVLRDEWERERPKGQGREVRQI